METENTQENVAPEQMTPDEAAASLSFATKLLEGMNAPAEGMAQPSPEMGGGEPAPAPAPQEMPGLDIKAEIRKAVKEEVPSIIRTELNQILNEEEGQD